VNKNIFLKKNNVFSAFFMHNLSIPRVRGAFNIFNTRGDVTFIRTSNKYLKQRQLEKSKL